LANVEEKVALAGIHANPLIWPVAESQSLRVYRDAGIPRETFALSAVVALLAVVALSALVALAALVALVAFVAVSALVACPASSADGTVPKAPRLMLAAVIARFAIFAPVIAPFLSFGVVTAPLLICLVPTPDAGISQDLRQAR